MTRRFRTAVLGLWLLPALLLPAGGLSELCLCLRMFAFEPCCAQPSPGAGDAAEQPSGCCSGEFAEGSRTAPTRSAPVVEGPEQDDGPCTVVATPRGEPATPPADPFEVPAVDVLARVELTTTPAASPRGDTPRVGGARAPPPRRALCQRPGALPLRL